jgi:Domain of unknown function (DUF4333)
MRIGIPVSLACAAVLVAGCSFGPGAVSKASVEKKIADSLEKQIGQRPKAIICPDDLKATVGTRMRCQLVAPDGTKIGLTVRVTSVKGDDVNYHFQVDKK